MKIKVLFVCHGNICRSPMAEFVLRDMVNKRGYGEYFDIESAATSTEEIGNSVHPGTKAILETYGITAEGKHAVQMKRTDYDKYDYIVAMDNRNVQNILRIIGNDTMNKVNKILEFTGQSRDVADPWYTGDFNKTYEDVKQGCEALFENICRSNSYIFEEKIG